VFRMVDVNDFKVKLCTEQDRELLKLMIELNRAADLAVAASKLRTAFEVRPTVEIFDPRNAPQPRGFRRAGGK
jgi:hypothetical protein